MQHFFTPDFIFLKQINSITEYWESLKPQNDVGAALEESWKKKVEFLDTVSAQNNAVVFLSNIYTNRCLYMSDKLNIMAGLDPSLFTAENFMEYSVSRMHPNQLAAILQLSQKCFNYCIEHKLHNPKNVTFCLNYLYKNGNNEYVQVLQRAAILEVDDNGSPCLVLNFINFIGHIKKHESVGCVILTSNEVNIFNYDIDKKCIKDPITISDHEKKIINLLAEGLDSKSISKILFVSSHTVDTHRRNLIKKMECLNTTGVVEFAKLINLI